MFRWIPYTFLRTVMFFIGGILLGFYAPNLLDTTLSLTLVALFVLLYILLVIAGPRLRRNWNPGLMALPLIFLLGYIHVERQTESRDPQHLLYVDEAINFYKVVITKFAEEKAHSWKIEARVSEVHTHEWQDKTGKIILYFLKTDFAEAFSYGDVLLLRGSPEELESPANPGEFDYKRFLSFKNIYHQDFIRRGDVVLLGNLPPSYVMGYAIQGRLWAEHTLKKFVHGEREQAVATALVLGVTDGLDNELLQAYSATGSMHVLAVSGLHVSIIYFMILWILKPLNKVRGGRWLVAITSLFILWMYAFVTGVTPSVLRAVTMFSFIALASPWSRRTNIYNTLAVSAFFLLLYDPFMIWSVGFQLSYLAVLGIVYLYPRFVTWWEPKAWITTEIWKIICVSIAAQIATFSLGLLYFHQFPNYFLLSNLLVVPLSFAILILGLMVLGLSTISVLAAIAGFCLEHTIRLVNYIVFTIEGFPFNAIRNIYIDPLQCCLLMTLILVVIALAEFKQFKYILIGCLVICLYGGLQWVHFSREVSIKEFIVYKVPGHSAMDLIDRGHAFFVTDSLLKTDQHKLGFHISPNRLMTGVRKITALPQYSNLIPGGRIISWEGKTILHITDANFKPPERLTVDWLVIGNNAVSEIEHIARNITCGTLILDSSNSPYFAARFIEKAKLYKFDVHSVLHHGAFAYKIETSDS